MTNKTKLIIGLVALAAVIVVVWLAISGAQTENKLIATATYTCDGGKTITAAYYQGPPAPQPQPGEPPMSNDTVRLTFDNGLTMTLKRTISADGVRFANANESFVFWNKGNDALVLQDGEQKDYTNCTSGGTGSMQSVSTGKGITFSYPTGGDFGLAVTPEQVLEKAYIPPCEEGFDYCLYYLGTDYEGTNFESAGLSIKARPDLTADTCLAAPPSGYTRQLEATTTRGEGYTASVMGPVGDAAVGHYTNGSVYRLHFDDTCYEFVTRIGETQFANYPPGAIKEFTAADREAMMQKLQGLLDTVKLTETGVPVVFPA